MPKRLQAERLGNVSMDIGCFAAISPTFEDSSPGKDVKGPRICMIFE